MSTNVMDAPATGFAYRQKTSDLHDTAGMTQALHEDGFALIPGVISREEVDELRDAIDRLRPFGFDVQGKTDHYKCVFNRDQLFLNYLDRPGVIDLAESTMGDECHVIGQSAWRSRPGHNGWSPHTDRVFFEAPASIADNPEFAPPIYLCTAHYYLNDMTLDLAPTYVLPGSHLSGRSLHGEKHPVFKGKELEPVLCKAGDVLFFRSEVWHSGSENSSAETRYLLQVHYSHRWIAQQFSPFLSFQFSNEILEVANERQLRLLGNHRKGAYD